MTQLLILCGSMIAGLIFGFITEKMGIQKEERDIMRLSISFGFGIGPVLLSLYQQWRS